MANVLTVPNSGIISFDSRAYSNLTVPPLSTSARIIYDGGGGINITSYTTATTALDRFSVDGTQGRLFSVTDALTGTLFSVNNITGLPILEVQDSNTVIAGQYNTNAFVLSGTRTGLGTTPIGTNRLSVSGDSTFVGIISTSSHGTSREWIDIGAITSIVSLTATLELSSSSYFLINLNSNINTFTFRNPKPAPIITNFVVQLCADGTPRAVVWPTSIKWPDGQLPVVTSTLNKVDTVTLFSYDGGNNYFGFSSGTNS